MEHVWWGLASLIFYKYPQIACEHFEILPAQIWGVLGVCIIATHFEILEISSQVLGAGSHGLVYSPVSGPHMGDNSCISKGRPNIWNFVCKTLANIVFKSGRIISNNWSFAWRWALNIWNSLMSGQPIFQGPGSLNQEIECQIGFRSRDQVLDRGIGVWIGVGSGDRQLDRSWIGVESRDQSRIRGPKRRLRDPGLAPQRVIPQFLHFYLDNSVAPWNPTRQTDCALSDWPSFGEKWVRFRYVPLCYSM